MNSTWKVNTESGKRLFALLVAAGIVVKENDVVAFCYEDGEDTGYVSHNFMSTGVNALRADFDEKELADDGIKIWRTWSFKS